MAEGVIVALATPLAFLSWRTRQRPDNPSNHRAWLQAVLQDARREFTALTMLLGLGLESGGVAVLYWISLVRGGLLRDGAATTGAVALTMITAFVSLLPEATNSSANGTLSAYAQALSSFTYYAIWKNDPSIQNSRTGKIKRSAHMS